MKKSLRDILQTIKDKENACIVILDELTDVHNVGAIVRTAVATGCDAVVIPKYNQAPINDTVVRTSAYTADKIPIIEMNVNEAIRTLKDNHFWIHGLFMKSAINLWKSDLTGRIAIVVGNEGDGIHAGTEKLCDFALSIPMDKKVESLNASVSTAIALYEHLRQISK
jgi:23S rRNA (guanosine2251-2'-O)-methyltransferase